MSTMMKHLQQACRAGQLPDIALHFAGLLHRLDPNVDESILLAGALVGDRAISGEVCVDLSRLVSSTLFDSDEGPKISAPDLDTWLQSLKSSPLVSDGAAPAPLIITPDGRLYLYRYFELERRLAELIVHRTHVCDVSIDSTRLEAALDELFADDLISADQRSAATLAVHNRFSIISGGPGTGKTVTVVRILVLLRQLGLVAPDRMLLCAPTGKAAARLREALADTPPAVMPGDILPPDAVTVHRLLGWRPGKKPRYHADRPLPCDLLVLDEASMVDLALMVSLLEALPPQARLILLGDRDQLSSVEAGAVLGDICRAADSGALEGVLTTLSHNWRFGANSAIANLASAIREARAKDAIGILDNTGSTEVTLQPVDDNDLDALLAEQVIPVYAEIAQLVREGARAKTIFSKLNELMVLCAHRNGPRGVTDINQRVSNQLGASAVLSPAVQAYPGMPLMVARNDPALGLFNGDIGIVMPDINTPEHLQAVFLDASGDEHAVSLGRLPEYQAAYAITVHKAQGSQAARVVLILPAQVSRVLSRELIYTGITRARSSLAIWGDREVLTGAIGRSAQRVMGLVERLKEVSIRAA
ncbi:MAG TPA: exodeoxyribonuclease V subunit alpha [Arenicellales bacterium]|jgi:exodeoxyribonuclease V alpha subunit|nr:exodeoxyribonuclease V subunit alpha [Arenicellales bacterium]